MRRVVLALLAGCAPLPGAPCEQVGEPGLELAPATVEFGAFHEGDAIPVGHPPQGGAPYTPLRARVSGLTDLDRGVSIELSAVDLADGSDLGEVSYDLRLVCANVGDSAGTWVAGDVHLRYFGWDLEDLFGRSAEVRVQVTGLDGESVEQSIIGQLVEH